jgi:hypothetical protein
VPAVPPPAPAVANEADELRKLNRAEEKVERQRQSALPVTVEVLSARGAYDPAQDTGRLRAGDRVRIRYMPAQGGRLNVILREGSHSRTIETLSVEAGRQIFIPSSGHLPSDAGEKVISLTFDAAAPAASALQDQVGARLAAAKEAAAPAVTLRLTFLR